MSIVSQKTDFFWGNIYQKTLLFNHFMAFKNRAKINQALIGAKQASSRKRFRKTKQVIKKRKKWYRFLFRKRIQIRHSSIYQTQIRRRRWYLRNLKRKRFTERVWSYKKTFYPPDKYRELINREHYVRKKTKQLNALEEQYPQYRYMENRIGRFEVYITKNGTKQNRLFYANNLFSALDFFDKQVLENKEYVIGSKTVEKVGKKKKTIEYNIILTEDVSEKNWSTSTFSDEIGSSYEALVVSKNTNKKRIAVALEDYKIPQLYYVCSLQKVTNGNWLYENILSPINELTQIVLYKNKLFIRSEKIFDTVASIEDEDAMSLYQDLYKMLKRDKNFFFTEATTEESGNVWLRKAYKTFKLSEKKLEEKATNKILKEEEKQQSAES